MLRLNRIVVGYDGREGGREALALALDLADRDASRLVVVCGFPAIGVHDALPSRADGLLEADAERALEDARAQLGGAQDAEYVAVLGARPALTLQDLAREHRADLVVIGSSRRSPVGRVLGGDVLAGLLSDPACPVCVSPRGSRARQEIKRVGVAVDGSAESDAALALTSRLLGEGEASADDVEVIFVDDTPPDGDRADARRDDAVALLDAAAAQLPAALHVREHVAHGDPAETLAALTAELDLLVVGHRSRGPLGNLLHRSVSGHVAAHADCPVVIAPLARSPAEPAR